MSRRWSTYRAWHTAQPARPAVESLTTLRMVGWALVFGVLLYVMLIRSNPEGVQYGVPEWCPADAQVCDEWSAGMTR